MTDRNIAVVGIGCWYPGAVGARQLWENVLARRAQFRTIPDCRLPPADYYDPDPSTPDKTYVKSAAVIDGFTFDWSGHHIPRSTFESTDIVQWLALEVAERALGDAGYTREKVPSERTRVVIGNSLGGEQAITSLILRLRWPYLRRALHNAVGALGGLNPAVVAELEQVFEREVKEPLARVNEDTLQGVLSNTVAGRVANYFNLRGGGYTVDGACSSSLLAIESGATALATGEADLVLAGGVDVNLNPIELVGFAKTSALTRGEMSVFDRKASGFLPGEGCGIVVLKRLEDARRDGDEVYAVVRGWGMSSDGKGGMTAPSRDGQALAVRRAMEMARVQPSEVSFVECHGTGTKVGDRTELEGLSSAYAQLGGAPPRAVGVGSLKSVIGHTKAAAGVGGFIKTVVALNRRVLPPTAGVTEPSATFEGPGQSLFPLREGEVREGATKLVAGVSSFGFGGINCHLVLESGDAPSARLAPGLDERALIASHQGTELFVLGAESRAALRRQVEATLARAGGLAASELVDLAAAMGAECAPGQAFRAAVVASSSDELLARLQQLLRRLTDDPSLEPDSPERAKKELIEQVFLGETKGGLRLGFLFPGQGSQQLQAARRLVERFDWARELVERADGWVREAGGPPIAEVLFQKLDRVLEPAELERRAKALAETECAQPAIVLGSLLWLHFLRRLGVKPSVVAGHSLGELTAFHAAGAFDERTLMSLAAVRGRAMAAPGGEAGGMVALAGSRADAERLLEGIPGCATVANINSPQQVVVAGDAAAMEMFVARAGEAKLRARRLVVSNAFHSRLVEPAARRLESWDGLPTSAAPFSSKLYSSVTGQPVAPEVSLRRHFSEQVLRPVEFQRMVETLAGEVDLLWEVGPGRVLSDLTAACLPNGPHALPIEGRAGNDRDLHNALAAFHVRGGEVSWKELYGRRLVRPFVPASARVFIENPCERLERKATPAAAATSTAALSPGLLGKLDLPAAQLSAYLERRGRFLAEVIRADLATLDGPAAVSAAVTRTETVTPTARTATVSRAPATVPNGATDLRELVVGLVAERTGYARAAIRPEARLLDDLNLDSIKAGELVSTLAGRLGVADQLDPSPLANARVSEIVSALEKLTPSQRTSSERVEQPAAAPPPPPRAAPAPQRAAPLAVIAELVHRRTGYAAAQILPSHRLLDDLNLDSIKAGELVAESARALGVTPPADLVSLANARLSELAEALAPPSNPEHEAAPSPAAAPPAQTVSPIDAVLAEAATVTGYLRANLRPEALLEADLNLDAEKIWRIFSGAAGRLGVAPAADIGPLSERTLGHLATVLGQLVLKRDHGQPSSEAAAAPMDNIVREFILEPEEEPLRPPPTGWARRQEDDWSQARLLVVHEAPDAEVAEALKRTAMGRGAQVQALTFQEARSVDPGEFSHVLVVLDRGTQVAASAAPAAQRVREAVERLRFVARLPSASDQRRRRTSLGFLQFADSTLGVPGRFDRGSATAFAASLHLEREDLRVRAVEVMTHLEPDAFASSVLDELVTPPAFQAVSFDERMTRFVIRPRVREPFADPTRRTQWTPDDVVVVTGGARGITAECALAFARKFRVRMALVGRSTSTAGDSASHLELSRTLERFAEAGLTARYYSCDVTDRASVDRVLGQVRTELGEITGVIHGAAINKPRRVEQASLESVLEEIGPKLLGVINLCEALAHRPPKVMVGMASIIGVTGMPGNAWYAFSNEAMDACLREFNRAHPECDVLSIAYGVWSEVGMGARLGAVKNLAKRGIGAIPPEEGSRRFAHLMERSPGQPLVVVTAQMGGIDTWLVRRPPLSGQKFLEELVLDEPGVAVVARCKLTHEKAPFLRDHLFRGSFLLPTVFGLEAMSEAVARVTGLAPELLRALEDVKLHRPVVVPPDEGVGIELRATVLERESRSEPRKVKVELRSASSGYQRPHFEATFVLGELAHDATRAPTDAPRALPLEPLQDLYGKLLWQGPLFHRIREVNAISSQAAVMRIELVSPARAEGGPWQFGDPYGRDALLQSISVVTTPDVCLPVGVDRWERHAAGPHGLCTAVLRKTATEGKQHIFTVECFDERGRLVERLHNYRVHIVERSKTLPTPEELLRPDERDARLVRTQLSEAAQTLGIHPPHIGVTPFPGAHDLPKEVRREREASLMSPELSSLWKARGLPGDVSLEWDSAGKPHLKGGAEPRLDVSISHDGGVLLWSVGTHTQACDIEPVAERESSMYRQLVGPSGVPVLEHLLGTGESLALAGTRLWSARECIQKAWGLANLASISVEKASQEAVLLHARASSGEALRILTVPVALTLGPTRVVAVAVEGRKD